MATVTIDPTKAGILPEGEYNAYIAKAEQKVSEKGNVYYNIEFELINNPQYNGRKVWQNYGIETSFFLQMLSAIGFNYPEDREFQFDDRFLGGKHCRIKVHHEDYTDRDGKTKKTSKVGDVMPASANTSRNVSEPEADPFDEEDMPF